MFSITIFKSVPDVPLNINQKDPAKWKKVSLVSKAKPFLISLVQITRSIYNFFSVDDVKTIRNERDSTPLLVLLTPYSAHELVYIPAFHNVSINIMLHLYKQFENSMPQSHVNLILFLCHCYLNVHMIYCMLPKWNWFHHPKGSL